MAQNGSVCSALRLWCLSQALPQAGMDRASGPREMLRMSIRILKCERKRRSARPISAWGNAQDSGDDASKKHGAVTKHQRRRRDLYQPGATPQERAEQGKRAVSPSHRDGDATIPMGRSSTNDTYGIDLWRGLTALDDFPESTPRALPQAGMKRALRGFISGLEPVC